jgi:hypothetical protein
MWGGASSDVDRQPVRKLGHYSQPRTVEGATKPPWATGGTMLQPPSSRSPRGGGAACAGAGERAFPAGADRKVAERSFARQHKFAVEGSASVRAPVVSHSPAGVHLSLRPTAQQQQPPQQQPQQQQAAATSITEAPRRKFSKANADSGAAACLNQHSPEPTTARRRAGIRSQGAVSVQSVVEDAPPARGRATVNGRGPTLSSSSNAEPIGGSPERFEQQRATEGQKRIERWNAATARPNHRIIAGLHEAAGGGGGGGAAAEGSSRSPPALSGRNVITGQVPSGETYTEVLAIGQESILDARPSPGIACRLEYAEKHRQPSVGVHGHCVSPSPGATTHENAGARAQGLLSGKIRPSSIQVSEQGLVSNNAREMMGGKGRGHFGAQRAGGQRASGRRQVADKPRDELAGRPPWQ